MVVGMILTKAQALRASKRIFVVIDVPELDGQLRLASLSAGASAELQALKARLDQGLLVGKEMMVTMVAHAVVDEQGAPLFEKSEAEKFVDTISTETIGLIMRSVPVAEAVPAPPSVAISSGA